MSKCYTIHIQLAIYCGIHSGELLFKQSYVAPLPLELDHQVSPPVIIIMTHYHSNSVVYFKYLEASLGSSLLLMTMLRKIQQGEDSTFLSLSQSSGLAVPQQAVI